MSARHDATLKDSAERVAAATDLERTYLIEAAAGTGKTTLLVERVLNLVRQKHTPLARIVAITFTEKAAGELKIKLRSALEQARREELEDRGIFAAALYDLDAMPVGTIHSFCRDLIAQRPVEAGTDPGFVVADEAEARLLREETWEAWMAKELENESCPALPFLRRGVPVASFGTELSLRAIFDVMVERRDDLSRLHVATLLPEVLLEHAGAFARATAEAAGLAQFCRREDDKLARTLRSLARWQSQNDWRTLEGVSQALRSAPQTSKARSGQKENWAKSELEQARKFTQTFGEQRDELNAALTSLLAAPIIEWLKGAVTAYEQAKREHAWLDFNDLLFVARELLLQHAAVREDFKARYDYLLIDEFQDTDPLQAEIVFYLAEQPGDFAGRWSDVNVVPGKLFMVADPKQSIYRFRRADLDLYGAVRSKVEKIGRCLPIRVNFRSDPGLIQGVNNVFSTLMTGAQADHYEPDYVPMEPHRASAESPRIMVLPPPSAEQTDMSADQLIAQEAACIGEYVLTEVKASARHYRDFGLLFSTSTHLRHLEQALRARSIPYHLTGGKDFAKRTEIQALQTVLAAIDNPYHQMTVVGALRTPFFACTDEDLLSHHMDGGDFAYTTAQSTNSAIQTAFSTLCSLHERRRNNQLSSVVAALLEETPALAVYGLKPHGESRIGNLLKVLDWAQEFEREGASFHDLSQWLGRMEQLRASEDDSLPVESGDDVVQLMTFHKAKGLEFPVVILYDLAREFGKMQSKILLDRHTCALELTGKTGKTRGFDDLQTHEQERERYEAMRLLYVAMTRARDQLVLPLYWASKRAAERRWLLQFLKETFVCNDSGEFSLSGEHVSVVDTRSYSLESPPQENIVVEIPEFASSTNNEGDDRRVARDAAALSLRREGTLVRPSDLVILPDMTTTPVVSAPGEPAAVFGQFVHRILERISLPDARNWVEAVDAAAQEFPVSDTRRAEGERLVRGYLDSEFFRRRVQPANKWWRELDFAAEVNGIIIEGAMDLLFFENGMPVLVDFKSDVVPPSQLLARAELYRGQTDAYVSAVERILGVEVSGVFLYFLRAGAAVQITRSNCTLI